MGPENAKLRKADMISLDKTFGILGWREIKRVHQREKAVFEKRGHLVLALLFGSKQRKTSPQGEAPLHQGALRKLNLAQFESLNPPVWYPRNGPVILAKPGAMFSLGLNVNGRYKAMLRKAFILLLMVALLWLSGCATSGVSDPRSAAFGPCASRMDARYCGP